MCPCVGLEKWVSLQINIYHFPGICQRCLAFQCFINSCVDFSRGGYIFCKVLVLAVMYGTIFLQCLHIVAVLSVILSPFIISTGYPKCSHTSEWRGASSMLISSSTLDSIVLANALPLLCTDIARQLFTLTRNMVTFFITRYLCAQDLVAPLFVADPRSFQ